MAKKKKRRKLPRNIVEKTDREALTRILGKRVMKEADAVADEWRGKHEKLTMD